MRTNLAIAALIFPMVQGLVFGLALLGLLAVGAPGGLYPATIAATFLVSLPMSLLIAPRLRSRFSRQRHGGRLMGSPAAVPLAEQPGVSAGVTS